MNETTPVSIESGAARDLESLKSITHAVYLLQAIGLCLPLTFIPALIINYVKRDDIHGTWLASHFRWQIRTFWFGLLWAVLGGLTFLVVVGWFILLADWIWLLYRVIKGWLNLFDRKPMYAGP